MLYVWLTDDWRTLYMDLNMKPCYESPIHHVHQCIKHCVRVCYRRLNVSTKEVVFNFYCVVWCLRNHVWILSWCRHQKYFPRYWPLLGGFPDKGQWGRALMFSLMCAWINGWTNSGVIETPSCSLWRHYNVHWELDCTYTYYSNHAWRTRK